MLLSGYTHLEWHCTWAILIGLTSLKDDAPAQTHTVARPALHEGYTILVLKLCPHYKLHLIVLWENFVFVIMRTESVMRNGKNSTNGLTCAFHVTWLTCKLLTWTDELDTISAHFLTFCCKGLWNEHWEKCIFMNYQMVAWLHIAYCFYVAFGDLKSCNPPWLKGWLLPGMVAYQCAKYINNNRLNAQEFGSHGHVALWPVFPCCFISWHYSARTL